MEFRQSGHRDERRRRVLIDDSPDSAASENDPSTESAHGDTAATPESHRYSSAALARHQPPLTCLIPKRAWVLLLLVTVSASAVAGVEWLYAQVFIALSDIDRSMFAALDVHARGSLAAWLASSSLLVGAATSLMVFALRRYKLDDYRGKYRMWVWVSMAFVLASICAGTGVHQALGPVVTEAAGFANDSADIWTLAIVASVVGLYLVRLAVEMWRSRSSIAMLALGAGSLLAFVLLETGVVRAHDAFVGEIVASSCLLAGQLAIVATIVVYARYVYLEAQGEIGGATDSRPSVASAVVPPESEEAPAAEEDTAPSPPRKARRKNRPSVRVDTAHEKPARTEPASTEPEPDAPSFGESDPIEPPTLETDDGRKLSKAERRRLRKQARRQQQRAG